MKVERFSIAAALLLLVAIFGCKSPAVQTAAPPVQGRPWTNSLGMRFVPVPGAEVLFCIWETRVQDYQAFVSATGRSQEKLSSGQGPNHPAVDVSWKAAKAWCEWLTQKERREGRLGAGQSYRLPTDAEWSVAAGLPPESGSTPAEKNMKIKDVYPWGNQWPPPAGTGNYDPSLNVDSYEKAAPVSSFPANKLGLCDLSGNVWVWCEDRYDNEQEYRVLRGGSWCDRDAARLLSSFRTCLTPDSHGVNYGFRVVLAGDSSR